MEKGNIFLSVRPGDLVLIENNCQEDAIDWWQGLVIHITSSARDPSMNTIFQVICINTGTVKTVNADLVKGIVNSKEKLSEKGLRKNSRSRLGE